MAKIRTLAAIAVLLMTSSAFAQDVKTLAEGEGKMMFYASFNATHSKVLTDGFKQLYPKIDATFYRATDAQMMERILTEARAGRNLWDVMMTSSFYGYNLKKRGMLAPYDSPERKFYREGYKDPQATWTSIYTNYAAFGFNTRSVAKANIPKTYADLLKPEWKGNIGLDSRPYEWFGTMVKAMGDEKGLSYMRELAKQAQLRNGRTILAQLVAAGEFKGFISIRCLPTSIPWVSRPRLPIPTRASFLSISFFPSAARSWFAAWTESRTGLTRRRSRRASSKASSPLSHPARCSKSSNATPRFFTTSSAAASPFGAVSPRRHEGHEGFGTFLRHTRRLFRNQSSLAGVHPECSRRAPDKLCG